MIREIKDLPIFFTKMASSHLFVVRDIKSHKSLSALSNSIVLCVSAIGSANAFVQGVKKVLLLLLLSLLCVHVYIIYGMLNSATRLLVL